MADMEGPKNNNGVFSKLITAHQSVKKLFGPGQAKPSQVEGDLNRLSPDERFLELQSRRQRSRMDGLESKRQPSTSVSLPHQSTNSVPTAVTNAAPAVPPLSLTNAAPAPVTNSVPAGPDVTADGMHLPPATRIKS